MLLTLVPRKSRRATVMAFPGQPHVSLLWFVPLIASYIHVGSCGPQLCSRTHTWAVTPFVVYRALSTPHIFRRRLTTLFLLQKYHSYSGSFTVPYTFRNDWKQPKLLPTGVLNSPRGLSGKKYIPFNICPLSLNDPSDNLIIPALYPQTSL